MTDTAFIIALTGGSGSGKSTVADALAARLGPSRTVIFSEDAYYWPMAHYRALDTEAAREAIGEKINYDDPASKEATLMATHLAALKAGKPIDQPVYDYEQHDRSAETKRLDPVPVIILEGIHALSVPEISDLIDLSVYVDTPDDLRLARRIRRDVLERGRSVESVLGQYLSTVRPAHYAFTHPAKFKAHLVLADEGLPAYGKVRPSEQAIARMLAPILERLAVQGLI